MKFSFVKQRYKAYLFSGVLLLAGLVSFFVHGFNLGIDFVGGTVFNLSLDEAFTVAEVQEVLTPFGLQGAAVQVVQGRDLLGAVATEGVVIKTAFLEEDQRNGIINAFRERFPGLGPEEIQVESVGAIIGGELAGKSLLALGIAIAAMIGYITLRFEFKFAVATIAALVHDVLAITAIFLLLRLEINAPFVAAILTVFGYSVNDTIVIIDRIRENIRHRRRKEYEAVVDLSIQQSLVRCLNTSFTTLLVLVSLLVGFVYYIGSLDLIVFVVALIFGVFIGTYSSIFIASPLWLDLGGLESRRAQR